MNSEIIRILISIRVLGIVYIILFKKYFLEKSMAKRGKLLRNILEKTIKEGNLGSPLRRGLRQVKQTSVPF
jgi:hypothetical protein